MNYNLDIQKILLQVNKNADSEDKIRLLKQAINIADVNNDIDWGMDLRLDVIREEIDLPSHSESFPAFVWVLNAYENNPDLIDEKEFLWEYKWMVDAAICDINIPLEQVDQIIEDYRKRLHRNGYSDYIYYSMMLYKHMFLGEFDEAEAMIRAKIELPRDMMSDHEDWEKDVRVLLSLKQQKFDDAIFQAQDLLNRKSNCEGIPFATVSSMSYYLAKGGDKRAKEITDRANQEMEVFRPTPSFLCNVAQIVFSNYMTGDTEKAWLFFEQSLHWTLTANEFLKFDYIVFVLPLLKEKQNRTLNLSHKLPFYKTDNIYDTEEIYNYFYPIACEISERFDIRNQNKIFSNRLKEHLLF